MDLEGALGASLGKRLFTTRLELIGTLDTQLQAELVLRECPDHLDALRKETASLLREEVAAMNLDNFIVRLRRYIEDDPGKPQHLLTVRGVGYLLTEAKS